MPALTDVEFQFYHPDGSPLADTAFSITLKRSGFITEAVGVVVPDVITALTDATGKVVIPLHPSSTPYYLQLPSDVAIEEDCCSGVLARYKFYVPEVAAGVIVRAQDLFLAVAPSNTSYDEAAILIITEAKLTSVNAAREALASAVRAETAATTIEGDADRAEAARDAAEASKNAAGVYAQNAADNNTWAGQSAASANASKNAAAGSATAASNSAVSASDDAGRAAASATAAAGSATTASNSKDAAAASAAASLSSKNSAEAAAGTATTKAAEAVTSANNAAGSANTANTKAGDAAASATAAKTSETNAKTSETNAATSATNASTAGAAAGTTAANAVVANKQDKSDNLTAFSGLVGVADRLPYFTGAGALSLAAITSKARLLMACTTGADMRAEIAAAAKGANSDITSLSGLTTPLSVAQGGTGGITQTAAQTGLGLVPAALTATAGDYPNGILKTGHAGWNGGAAVVIGNGANCDTLVNAFLYALNGTFTNGPPSFGTASFFLWVSVHGTGYESQEAFGITHGGRAERRRINGVWQPWTNIYNGVNATLDPSGTGGGLMSSAIFGNYLVSKYANGEINIRGLAPETVIFSSGEIRVVTVALPVTLVNSGLGYFYKATTNVQPKQTYDFYGVVAEYMSDANTAAFVIRNGATAQTFQPTINVWGRWK